MKSKGAKMTTREEVEKFLEEAKVDLTQWIFFDGYVYQIEEAASYDFSKMRIEKDCLMYNTEIIATK